MPKTVTYTDSIDMSFGKLFPSDYFYIDEGVLKSKMTKKQIAAAKRKQVGGVSYAEVLAKMLQDQPRLAEIDPVNWGWILPAQQRIFEEWKDTDMFVIFGGGRSGKSVFASKVCEEVMEEIPEAKVRGWHVNEDRSQEDMQRFMWDALPMRYKNLKPKKGQNYNVQWNQTTGFTNETLTLPPKIHGQMGSQMIFNNYKQYLFDKQMAEGCASHLNWCDEEAPASLIDTLQSRGSADFHSKLILTVTTLQGWTDLVDAILQDVTTVKTRYSEYVGKELPYEQISHRFDRCKVFYFWTMDNPFVDYKRLEEKYQNFPIDVKMARLHGIPTRTHGLSFPNFNHDIHIVNDSDLPWLQHLKSA
jgi:hypothetical protein